MPDERDIAQGSYILNLFNDVELLIEYASAYMNLLVQVNSKYKNDEHIELTNDEQKALTELTNAIRSLAFKCFTKLEALGIKKEVEDDYKKMEQAYKKITDEYVFEFEHVNNFAKYLNAVFVKSVSINKMLKSAKKELEGLTK